MITAKDQEILQKRRQFLNLFNLKYKDEASAADFHREYRNLIIACLKKKGDKILWQNNRVLDEDEQLSPTFEELILANVLGIIDFRLPVLVTDHYFQSMESAESLMDYQSDIFVKVPTFISEIQNSISISSQKQEDKPER